MHFLEPAAATVYSSGDVFWSRPGTLEVLCRFSGLVMFPFDTLSCPIEIGGWAHSGLVQGVLPSPSGCVTSATSTEEVAQNSYSEFWIKHTECSAHIYEYESYPGEFWPVLRFRVYLGRATMHYYAAFYVFPAGMLTVLSFSVFFLSFQTGERLGVGVTLVLMIEVAKVTMSENIPQCGQWLTAPPCVHFPRSHRVRDFQRLWSVPRVPLCARATGEMLWLELFYLVNFLFTLGSLLESAVCDLPRSPRPSQRLLTPSHERLILYAISLQVVLSLAYHDSDSLIPEAFLPSTWRLAFRSSVVRDTIVGSWEKRSRNAQLAASDLGTGVTLAARDVMTGLGTSQQLPRQRSPPNPADVSDDLQDVMITPRDERAVNEGDADGVSAAATLPRVPQPLQRCNVESLQSAAQEFEKKVSFGSAFSSSFVASRMKGISRQKSINNTNSIKQEDISRLIFFENLFFRLDIDGSSTISFDEMRRMLAFLALDMTADEVSTALVDADTDDSDGQLVRQPVSTLRPPGHPIHAPTVSAHPEVRGPRRTDTSLSTCASSICGTIRSCSSRLQRPTSPNSASRGCVAPTRSGSGSPCQSTCTRASGSPPCTARPSSSSCRSKSVTTTLVSSPTGHSWIRHHSSKRCPLKYGKIM